ncbi:MAG TPA: IPT/TIG domain-containing protein [Bryobacteraceae bacterium]|nr:IPT/TIG domain-containing protein [Bryobacteraceae bacterium]
MNVPVTNKLAANNTVDAQLSLDTGTGPSPANVAAELAAPSSVAFNGLSFTLLASGNVTLRITNLRADASGLTAPQQPILAFVSFSSTGNPAVSNNQFTVAVAQPGLLTESSSSGVRCNGSALPSKITLANLLAQGTGFFSTRVTEGYFSSFQPKDAFSDTGTRIMVRYSGFPTAARLFVPDFVAGSSAVTPTAGGDLGVPASGGQYAPSATGSLLLIRVTGADENGAGGSLAFPFPGMGTTTFTSASEVAMTGGAGNVVYEVVDASPSVRESAQFPTFVGLAPTGGNVIVADARVSFAPPSTVHAASSDPVPRFADVTPQSDCSTLGDCDASYFAHLSVTSPALEFTSPVGGGRQLKYSAVKNQGGGLMNWTATVSYQTGSGWLTVDPATGFNNTTLNVNVNPSALAAGVYQATITVDAGPLVGSKTLPVTLTISTTDKTPVIGSVENAATFQAGPLVAGSLGTITGSNLSGTNVAVSFDAIPAKLLYTSSTQINLQVPSELAFMQAAQMIVTVDGLVAAQTVPLAIVAPGIFSGGVLNQDGTPNSTSNPAALGSVLQIFATGLASARSGAISARLGNRAISPLNYAGPAPTVPGVQQVNLTIPTDLGATTANLSVCAVATDPNQPVCSPAVAVYVK